MSILTLHLHNYRLTRKGAKAYFRKDNWPDDMAYVISGDLKICGCGSTHLKPYDVGFSEVEVLAPVHQE